MEDQPPPPPPLKRKSEDIGWEYGTLVDPLRPNTVKCKLCDKVYTGGINRIKVHISGFEKGVAKCLKASSEDKAKCKAALEEGKKSKFEKLRGEENLRSGVHIQNKNNDEVFELDGLGSNGPRTIGSLDEFAWPIDPNPIDSKKMRQQNINDALWKEKTQAVHQYMAQWVYESGLAFNAVDNDAFRRFVEAVGKFGSSYQIPSQYQLREPLLKGVMEKTKNALKKHKEEREKNGCSLMTDAWTNRKRRSIMNLCVNCKEGTTFISSTEDSNEAHTGEYIFQYVDKAITEIGEDFVVQVVTDNESNNMAAATLLREKRPTIFWTSCATHTLNLMLEGIGMLKNFKGCIAKAKKFTIFIYAHHKSLALMRKYTNKHDIVRPGATRFASAFLTLQSLMDKGEALKSMFTSKAWENTKLSRGVKGKEAYATVVSQTFWNNVSLCLKVFAPLVSVLRLVDGDRKPAMGFLCGELNRAKEEIKEVFKNVEKNYLPILNIIHEKGSGRVDGPLHVVAYFLTPYYYYKNKNIGIGSLVMSNMFTCVSKFFYGDFTLQTEVINVELLKYKSMEGDFGIELAIEGCKNNDDKYDPVGWCGNYGCSTPNLQKMAIRILSLTTSSSGCERNWSTFEGIHTKKRNRLDADRLNNLVYVQFNSKIINKKEKLKNKKCDPLIASDASNAQDWIVKDGDEEFEPDSGLTWNVISEAMGADGILEPRRSERNVRELSDEEFEDEDESVDEEFDIVSDEE